MYRVGIIDDEPIIVEGLKKGIQWENLDCEVIGTAYNGQEGIDMIRSTKPDILFTDISMSCMDGLTMVAAIKSEFPKMQISILTGYREFDYAQRAISLGVTRFLLKPSKIDELREAIDTMIGKLKENGTIRDSIEARASERFSNLIERNQEADENAEANNFIVQNALEYIDHHYQEKLLLSDVADKVYVSQWHLSKLLNKHTGQNFSELLNTVRISKAKELLHNPAYRIGDAAVEVGFIDIAHFSRVFKKIEGISANEYRNKILARHVTKETM